MLFGSSSGHPRKLPLSPSTPPPRHTAIYCARQRNSSGRSTEIAGPEDISTTHECEILVLGCSPLSDQPAGPRAGRWVGCGEGGSTAARWLWAVGLWWGSARAQGAGRDWGRLAFPALGVVLWINNSLVSLALFFPSCGGSHQHNEQRGSSANKEGALVGLGDSLHPPPG